jgi:hypothetical protein
MDYLRNNLSIVFILIGIAAEFFLLKKLQQLGDKLKKLRTSGRVTNIVQTKGLQRLLLFIMLIVPPLVYFLTTTINKI